MPPELPGSEDDNLARNTLEQAGQALTQARSDIPAGFIEQLYARAVPEDVVHYGPADLAGLVHHALAQSAAADDLFNMLTAHQTTVLDVVLPRHVHEGVFRLTRDLAPHDFHNPVPGPLIS